MKSLKIPAVVICLILIGVLPKENGRSAKPASHISFLDVVSSYSDFQLRAQSEFHPNAEIDLSDGQKIFTEQCTLCHTARFVWESGMLAGEADSVLRAMLAKRDNILQPQERHSLLEFLKYRLPVR